MNSILKLFLAIIVLLVVQSCKKDEEISYQLKKPDKIEKQASAILDKNSPLVKHVKVLYASENVIFTWDLAHYRSIADLREDDTPTDERDYAESYYYYYGRVIDDSGLIHNNMTIRYYTQTYKVFVEEFKPLAKEYIAAAEFIIKNNITREQVEKIYEGLRNEIEEIRVNGGCTYDFVSNLSRYFPANAYDYEFESDVLRRVNQKLLQSIYSMDYSYDSLTGKFYATSWSKSTCGGQLSTWKSTLDNYILEAGNEAFPLLIPFLVKIGSNAVADFMMQATMSYLFDPNVSSWSQAYDKMNWVQVARSGLEGAIPWKVPGGRLGKAALTATGDVFVNMTNNPWGYSPEQAGLDFATGFIGDLAGGGIGELVTKYGKTNVINGLTKKLGMDENYVRRMLGDVGKYIRFLDDPVKASQFADEIININKATEGAGILLSGSPLSAINTASYYSTVPEQGASIFKTIIKNHMFEDGNKRTAVNMFKSFCNKSGITTSLTDAQMMDVATKVATNQIDDVLKISQQLIK